MPKLALPAGDLRPALAEMLQKCGLHVEGYGEGARSYHLRVPSRDEIAVRVFREKDIPIQVALGNYDLGVCSLAWVKEIQARFSGQTVVPLCDLGIGSGVVLAAGAKSELARLDDLASLPVVRIASEFPNLAEAFALSARLPAYRVQSVWGAAVAYPPEDADCVVVSAADEDAVRGYGLEPFGQLLKNSVWLIGNPGSLANKEMSALLGPLMSVAAPSARSNDMELPRPIANGGTTREQNAPRDVLRMTVPDGHQQRHVVDALTAAGLKFDGYEDGQTERRPSSAIEGLEVKVIRPHDMASLVATGDVDVAITGRDCLMEHRFSFPTSPAVEVLDLKRGQYDLSAVVADGVPASTIGGALEYWRSQGKSLVRVASEFPATADQYARSRHFWHYQVMPIAGASEGFVPEDADLLIEGTETGKTLAENHLKAIDLLYRSTTCVVARQDAGFSGRRLEVFETLMAALRASSEASSPV